MQLVFCSIFWSLFLLFYENPSLAQWILPRNKGKLHSETLALLNNLHGEDTPSGSGQPPANSSRGSTGDGHSAVERSITLESSDGSHLAGNPDSSQIGEKDASGEHSRWSSPALGDAEGSDTCNGRMSDEISIQFFAALTGEVLHSTCVPNGLLGQGLVDLVMKHHRKNRSGVYKLQHRCKPIERHTSIGVQGIVDGSEITCVWIPISDEQQHSIVAKMSDWTGGGNVVFSGEEMDILDSLVHLHWPKQTLDNLTIPSGLQSLTFGDKFNQSMDNTTLPSGLQSLTFGWDFNQSMDNMTLPSGLQSLTFGVGFNQSMDNTTLPSGLQSLTFGVRFNQNMNSTTLPSGLQSLTFGRAFNQSMSNMTLPSGLQSLTCGRDFQRRNRNLFIYALPNGIQVTIDEDTDSDEFIRNLTMDL